MKRIIYMALGAAALLLACSCEKEIKFTGKYDGEKLVVFSCASAGTPLSVKVDKSHFFLDANEMPYERGMKGALVKAEVDGHEFSFTEGENGNYVSEYVPSVGDKIILTVSKEGFKTVTAETIVPNTPNVKVRVLNVKEADREFNSVYVEVHMLLVFHDEASIGNYYRTQAYRVADDNDNYIYGKRLITDDVLLMAGTGGSIFDMDLDLGNGGGADSISGEFPDLLEDSTFDGQIRVFNVWIEETVSLEAVSMPNYGLDLESYVIEVNALSDDMYKYQVSLNAADGLAGDIGAIFGEPVCIHSNIEGGIGCFGSASTSFLKLK